MKRIGLLVYILIITALTVLVALFFWQFNIKISANKILEQKKNQLESAYSASKHLKELDVQKEGLKQRKEKLCRRLPVGEKKPLDLIKTLMRLGSRIGLRNIVFNVKESDPGSQAERSSSDIFPEGGRQQVSAQPKAGVTPLYFTMSFNGSFTQLLDFMKETASMERIVDIEEVKIKRDENILPYQKISLELITYTFL